MKYYYIFFILLFIICSAETCSKKEPTPPILPKADFTFEMSKNGEVKFKNASINAITYNWDFGDGKTSVDENPIHFYEDEQEFAVKLLVESKDKQINTISKKIIIDSYEPVPDFKVETLKSGTIKITNMSKFASVYTWTIEDKTQQNSKTEFEYTFKKNGNYSIKLNAEKPNGLSKSITKDIKVNNVFEHSCEIKDPSIDIIWYKSHVEGFKKYPPINRLYLHSYYGSISKKDAGHLNKNRPNLFDESDPVQLLIFRFTNSPNESQEKNEQFFIYYCDGVFITEGFDEYYPLINNIKGLYKFEVEKLK